MVEKSQNQFKIQHCPPIGSQKLAQNGAILGRKH